MRWPSGSSQNRCIQPLFIKWRTTACCAMTASMASRVWRCLNNGTNNTASASEYSAKVIQMPCQFLLWSG